MKIDHDGDGTNIDPDHLHGMISHRQGQSRFFFESDCVRRAEWIYLVRMPLWDVSPEWTMWVHYEVLRMVVM